MYFLKILLGFLVVFVLLRFLFSGLTADKYCKIQNAMVSNELVEPTQDERNWLNNQDPSFKITLNARAVKQCLNDQSKHIWPGLI